MRPQVMHVNYRKDHPHHRAQLAIWATAVGPWLRGDLPLGCCPDVRSLRPRAWWGRCAQTERTEYVVDTYGMARDQVVETNRVVLQLIAPNASSFESHRHGLSAAARTDVVLSGTAGVTDLAAAAYAVLLPRRTRVPGQGSRRPSCAPSDGLRRVAATFYDRRAIRWHLGLAYLLEGEPSEPNRRVPPPRR